MDSLICLSQHFVNKQNVRSFSNIIRSKILKQEEDASFLQSVFEEQTLVSEISEELRQILNILKDNLRSNCKDDFKKYFSAIHKGNDALCPVNKEDIFVSCWNALSEIVPRGLYGGNHNIKLFKKLVHKVVYSMKRQHVTLKSILYKWQVTSQPWKSLPENLSRHVLYKIIIWIIKFILSSMICLNFYVSTCKLDTDENKLHFFWKNHWQKFYDKTISDMIFSKVLRRYEPYCLSKKVRRSYVLSERLKLKTLKKNIPKLHLVLKVNNDYRPIVRYKNDAQNTSEKYKMKDRLYFLKTMTGKSYTKKIESQFNETFSQWVNLSRPKLYFIKTDLSNAFGSINREKLLKILSEKHMDFQKTEKSLYMKKKTAQQYKELIMEMRKPLLVRAGNTVFEWTEGLVQGYKYSPALSELYYSYMDDVYFSDHLKNSPSQIKVFTRVVDDYLYMTDSLKDALSFLNALSSYRNVNYEKTVVNFEHEYIRYSEEITFLGYSYNTNTLQVSRASNVYVSQMCYKIAFTSALGNLSKFLDNRIGQSGIQINSHIFNFIYNSEELIWNHIFTTFCLSANKFCTILSVLCEEKEMVYYLSVYKKRVVVKLGNSIIETLMRHKPVDFVFMYCINHFRYISYKALQLCAQKTSNCGVLLPFVNGELAKCNCLFGKWRDHACRIDSNGAMRRKAVKEICRRSDLRIIMKQFDTLPFGVQCHNHRDL